MKGFDADVVFIQAALEQRSEVSIAFVWTLPNGVGFDMVDHVVDVLGIEAGVGDAGVRMDVRTQVLVDLPLKRVALCIWNAHHADFFRVSIHQSHDNSFTRPAARAAVSFGPLPLVHVAVEATDKRLVCPLRPAA